MRMRLLLGGLLGILACLMVANSIFAVRYFFATRELQKMQAVVKMINNNRTVIQSLAGDAVRFGEKNPALNPILYQFGLKTNPAPTTPGKKP